MTVQTWQLLQDGGAPEYMYRDRTAWRCAYFVGKKKKWKQRISTKKCCPCTVNIACHVRQSIIGCRSSRKGGQVSETNIEPTGRWRPPRRKRCSVSKTPSEQRGESPSGETVGQVLKFVWRLCWKIYVVCMSLSPSDSFQSRFVTYLLNCPRIFLFCMGGKHEPQKRV